MGRKKRRPASAAAKSTQSHAESMPEPLSPWELAKNRGNVLYGQSRYDDALEQYMKAIVLLEFDTSNEGLLNTNADIRKKFSYLSETVATINYK